MGRRIMLKWEKLFKNFICSGKSERKLKMKYDKNKNQAKGSQIRNNRDE